MPKSSDISPQVWERVQQLILENRSAKEITEILNKEGTEISSASIRAFRRGGWKKYYNTKQECKTIEKYYIYSLEKIAERFEQIFDELMDKKKDWKDDDETAPLYLTAIDKLIKLMEIALKRMGELKTSLTQVNETNITYNTTFVQAVKNEIQRMVNEEHLLPISSMAKSLYKKKKVSV